MKYFDIRKVLSLYPNMTMYLIFGERSNGKTYSSLDLALEEYAKDGSQTAYLRRSREDLKASIVGELFASHIANGRFDKYFGEMEFPWNAVRVKGGMVYPQHIWYSDTGKRYSTTASTPLLITAALSTWVHTKGISFPKVKTVLFDEFLTNDLYLPDEVNTFQNVLSSFVRERGDVKVILLGNTVSKYSPYFTELGLTHIDEMKPGDAQTYESGDGKAKYLVMLTGKAGEKKSDKYFSVFNNKTSKMITGGAWEMSAYPIIPKELSTLKPVLTFFICFNRHLLRGEVVCLNDTYILFQPARIERFYKEDNTRIGWHADKICYTDFVSRNIYDKFNLCKQTDPLATILKTAIRTGKVYFASNEAGDLLSAYYKWGSSTSIV